MGRASNLVRLLLGPLHHNGMTGCGRVTRSSQLMHIQLTNHNTASKTPVARKRKHCNVIAKQQKRTRSSVEKQHKIEPDILGTDRLPSVVELPTFRHIPVCPMRATLRLTDGERWDDGVYLKRHEKYERLERQIVRRDKMWQREVIHRMKLLKQNDPIDHDDAPQITAIQVCKKLPKTCRRLR